MLLIFGERMPTTAKIIGEGPHFLLEMKEMV